MGKRGPAPPSPDRVARILVDAEQWGDKAAAQRHGVSVRTVEVYRSKYAANRNVVELCGQLKAAVAATWIDEAREARRKLIARMATLAEKAEDLPDVTSALKAMHEVITSHEVLRGSGPDAGAQRDDAGAESAPSSSEGAER